MASAIARRARWVRALTALGLLCSFSACSSSNEDVDGRCDQLKRHVIELRTRSLPDADRAAHAAALDSALAATNFTSECKSFTAKQRDCALAMADATELTGCVTSSASAAQP
jgi:hypothetical protein